MGTSRATHLHPSWEIPAVLLLSWQPDRQDLFDRGSSVSAEEMSTAHQGKTSSALNELFDCPEILRMEIEVKREVVKDQQVKLGELFREKRLYWKRDETLLLKRNVQDVGGGPQD